MGEKPRFLLDEHIAPEIARQLRRDGIDVLTIGEIEHLSDTDPNLLQWATENSRVFVTHDTDLMIIAQTILDHAGIVWAPERNATIGGWVRALREIVSTETAASMRGQFRIVSAK